MMSCAVEVPTWNLGQLQTELPKNVLTGSLRYEEFRPLGQGGKAEVFRCRDVTLGRDVAFKVLHYSLMESSVEQRMLVREARIMATLDHSHIPPIHDLGRDRYGRPYFTMALIQGSTLRDLMEAALAAADSADADATQLELVAHVLHAGEVLHHAHQLGVVHCDVKPENLVIGTDGKIRIIDWGLAALTVETELEEERLEDSWGRQGSPLYMSPEQVACDPMLQPATDIYSLACVLYECLTHESPLMGPTSRDTLELVATTDPKPPSEVAPDRNVSPALERICMQALSKSAEDRFESMGAFCENLRDAHLEQLIGFDRPW